MPTLSICIPTYNRSACLAELLDSILAENSADVEVVVGDDASPDDTEAVAATYADRLARFTYFRHPVNVGVDGNIAAVAARATGDYVWLMGDDDRIERGGIRRVLSALSAWPDAIALTVGVVDYDVTMRRMTGIRKMPRTQCFTGVGPAFSHLAELLGFISATLIRRTHWEAAAADPRARAMTNLYSQVYIAGLAVGARGRWGVVEEPCVGFRSGNDQLKRRVGWLERLKVDVRAYDEIAQLLFPDDARVRRAMARRIFDTHVIARIVNAKTEGTTARDALLAGLYLLRRYFALPRFWAFAVPLLVTPGAAVRAIRRAYQGTIRESGSGRARQFALNPAVRP
ncbi:glycosyl transferase family protein [Sphingomonas sp. LH128]|uniref:glycosyltransferase family 2 protein n=1 Tax=Sphingomonas sp. LH128 TaxID=473781 RepID=UPI00027C9C06|nr:glycosyltransferase family 2 protein [Sphingomonas sp. LH128]EJU11041.1 glycosyl transferase family protein [Sphingomonas sp. LH128]